MKFPVLYRTVNQKKRYYSLELTPTLFGQILLTREYGGLKNKKPTGIIKEYFSNLQDAVMAFENLVHLKQRKEYSITCKSSTPYRFYLLFAL